MKYSWKHSCRSLSVVLTVLLFVLLPVSMVFAQVPDDAVDAILGPFQRVLGSMTFVRNLANTLFWSLLLLEFVVSAISLFWTGGDLYAFGKYLAQRILIIGVFVFFYAQAPWFSSIVRATFAVLATRTMQNQSVAVVELNPSTVMSQGFEVGRDLIRQASIWDGIDAIPVMFAGLIMVILFALIAANMIVVLAELYLVSTLGIFILGFWGASWTRDIAWGYWRYLLGMCFKLAVLQLLVAIGLTVFEGWIDALVGNNIDLNTSVAILGFTLVFWTLTNTLPSAAASLINGRAGGGFGGVSGPGSPGSQMANAASSIAGSAGRMAGSAGHMAMAARAAGSIAKAEGAKGSAAVVSGAAGNIKKAVGEEISKTMQGINGPSSSRGAMSQRVNRNLNQKANSMNAANK